MNNFLILLGFLLLASCSESAEDKATSAMEKMKEAQESGDIKAAAEAKKEMAAAKKEMAEKANNTTIDEEFVTKVHNTLLPGVKETPVISDFMYMNSKYFLANTKVDEKTKLDFLANPEEFLKSAENKKSFDNQYFKVTKSSIRLASVLYTEFLKEEQSNENAVRAYYLANLAKGLDEKEAKSSAEKYQGSSSAYKLKDHYKRLTTKTIPKLQKIVKDLRQSEK